MFPQYTYYNIENENQHNMRQWIYILLPILSWISYYNFTNPLKFPWKTTPMITNFVTQSITN